MATMSLPAMAGSSIFRMLRIFRVRIAPAEEATIP